MSQHDGFPSHTFDRLRNQSGTSKMCPTGIYPYHLTKYIVETTNPITITP